MRKGTYPILLGLWLSALMLLAAPLAAQAADASAKAPPRVVVQMADGTPEKQGLLLANVNNLINHYGQGKVTVEVVALGPGLSLLYKDNPLSPRIRELASRGVHFKACENTMKAQGKKLSDLNPVSEPVPSGIAYIVDRQAAGWLYYRP